MTRTWRFPQEALCSGTMLQREMAAGNHADGSGTVSRLNTLTSLLTPQQASISCHVNMPRECLTQEGQATNQPLKKVLFGGQSGPYLRSDDSQDLPQLCASSCFDSDILEFCTI